MRLKDDLLFVSIASYRDPQLAPTIDDCLRKASNAARLRFGICWQHADDDLIPQRYFDDPRFRILDVDWRESKGACWARAEVMSLWQGEPWFLQVDSHCRFKQGWDEALIRTALALNNPRVVLSTYATPFVPGEHEVLEGAPLQIAFQGFTPEGIPHMKPLAIPNWHFLTQPRRARFLSAGFLFAPGSFVEEVPYDPELYFIGEEAAMTVRSFTHGYDLFHPCETIVWHDYVRAGGTKHWEDHTEEKETVATWDSRDLQSRERVRKLLSGKPLDAFNLGNARTLADYEAYAGISFSARRVQDYTMRSEEPPNPPLEAGWSESIFTWLVRLTIPATKLTPEARNDVALWYIGVEDEFGNEIYRRDLTASEVQSLPLHEPEIVLVCELQSGTIPAAWTVWPVNRITGWLQRIQGVLADHDYTIVREEPAESTDAETLTAP